MKKTKTRTTIVGRKEEYSRIRSCLRAGKNILLEGPVGVGKTHLVLAVLEALGFEHRRIDGDSRYSEQKLSGWFDPPMVMKSGFSEKAFYAGPLVEAMRTGSILFINELNRLPEGVQNVLLPAIDERLLPVPRLGTIRAKDGFSVIATQNPREFVATSHLSEAILDRFELITLDYQPEDEETEIVDARLSNSARKSAPELARMAVQLVRLTRNHPRVRRGASIRAALSIAELSSAMMAEGADLNTAFRNAVHMALPTRIEMESDADTDATPAQALKDLLNEWVDTILKKKS